MADKIDRLNGFSDIFSKEKLKTYKTETSEIKEKKFAGYSKPFKSIDVKQIKFFDSEGHVVGTKKFFPGGEIQYEFTGINGRVTQLTDKNNNGNFDEMRQFRGNKYGNPVVLTYYDINDNGEWYHEMQSRKIKNVLSKLNFFALFSN